MPSKERVVPGLVFLVFFVVGCAGFGQLFVLPLWREHQARNWQPTPCRVVSSKVAHDGELQLAFQYTVAGTSHESSRCGFLPMGASDINYSRAMVAHYPAGSDATCYVNPSDPHDAVLDRNVPSQVWGNSPLLLFVIVGLVGLGWASGLIRRRPFDDSRLEAICKKGSSQSLDLAGSRITDAGLSYLRGLPALRDLDLSGTQVSDFGLRELKGLKSLEVLVLDDTCVTDRGVAHLAELDQLNTLSLADTKVTDHCITILCSMPNLEDVNLSGTRVTDGGVADLPSDAKINSLDLSRTAITDTGLRHLANLTALKFLTLDETAVTDAGLACLDKLSNLEGLYLSDTAVTPKGVEPLQAALPDCEIET